MADIVDHIMTRMIAMYKARIVSYIMKRMIALYMAIHVGPNPQPLKCLDKGNVPGQL